MNDYYCVLTILVSGLIGFVFGYTTQKTELEENVKTLKTHISRYDV